MFNKYVNIDICVSNNGYILIKVYVLGYTAYTHI